jgi:hypothetical protein
VAVGVFVCLAAQYGLEELSVYMLTKNKKVEVYITLIINVTECVNKEAI